jgi:hypothetical protein
VDFEALVASRSNTSDPALTLRNVALQNSWQVLSLLYKTTLHPTSQALTRVCREHFNFSAQQNFGAAGDRNLKPKSPNKIPKYQTSNQRRSLAKLLVLDRFCEWLLRNASVSTGASAHAPHGRLCDNCLSCQQNKIATDAHAAGCFAAVVCSPPCPCLLPFALRHLPEKILCVGAFD